MSMVENLAEIKTKGMDEFLKSQTQKYRCPSCGDIVSVHDGKCYVCGYQGEKPIKKAGKAQWERGRWVPDPE
jgi:rubrerythrin